MPTMADRVSAGGSSGALVYSDGLEANAVTTDVATPFGGTYEFAEDTLQEGDVIVAQAFHTADVLAGEKGPACTFRFFLGGQSLSAGSATAGGMVSSTLTLRIGEPGGACVCPWISNNSYGEVTIDTTSALEFGSSYQFPTSDPINEATRKYLALWKYSAPG